MKYELKKASEHVYYMAGDEEQDQPYVYYVKGQNYSIAVDAGNSKQHVTEFYKLLSEEGLALPKFTVITHWHWDHTFGLSYIAGLSIANELTNKKLSEVCKWKWTPQDMKKREESGEDIAFCNECIAKAYNDLSDVHVKTADISISGRTVLDLGDIQVVLMPHDSTHSRDALFAYVVQDKALFVGDADCEDLYDNGGKFDKDRLKSLTEFITSIDFEHYLLGHDAPDTREGVLKYLKECAEQ